MKYLKLSILLFSAFSCLLSSCTQTKISDQGESPYVETVTDLGQEYIDSFIFFGESTTYHMKSRGVLSGGTSTKQVWGTKSGTLNLDTAITTTRIIYPETNEEIKLSEALRKKAPEKIMLSFGLNGAVQKINKGEDYFKTCYRSLIELIRESSPNTEIFIQSAFPIASNMDMSNYSIDAKTLNKYIDRINTWSREVAEENKIQYLDTASVLKNSDGFLYDEYQVGDGYHLTALAYEKILAYIRTNGQGEV